MINKATILGRLGKDPERKEVNGNTLLNFSVATTENYKDKSGEWQEKTEWHNVQAWNKVADYLSTKLKKGSLVYVEGKIQTRKYEKNGQDHYATSIMASIVKPLANLIKNETPQSELGESDEIPF